MRDLNEFRKNYPMYNDFSDQELADKIHSSFYPDMPKEQVYSRLGVGMSPQAARPSFDNNAQQGKPPSFLGRMVQDPIIQFGLGGADAMSNILAGMLPVSPETRRQMSAPQSNGGLASILGGIVAPTIGFMGAGGLAGAGAGALGEMPGIAGAIGRALATKAGQAGAGIAGGGALGLATSPEDRMGGLEKGAGIAAGLESLPFALQGALSGVKAIKGKSPEKLAASIVEGLSGGDQIDKNGQEVARRIHESYSGLKKEFDGRYGEILNAPAEDIKTLKTPFRSEGMKVVKSEPLTAGDIFVDPKSFRPSLGELTKHEITDISNAAKAFEKDSSFKNAHELQKALGDEGAALYRKNRIGVASDTERNMLRKLYSARDALKDDVYESIGPERAAAYKQVSDDYKRDVIPYKSDKNLLAIANGEVKNPGNNNLLGIFKDPEDHELKKVLSDLPKDTSDRIAFAHLGKYATQASPKALQTAFGKMNEMGLAPYATEGLTAQMQELSKALEKQEFLAKLGSVVGGAALGHNVLGAALGSGLSGGAGALAGLASAPLVQRATSGIRFPSVGQPQGGRQLWDLISASLKANLIPQNIQNKGE